MAYSFAVFRKRVFFTKFDLKSGYHHLDIFSEHQPYLGFSWKMNGETPSYFMFTVLPFGLTTAPYIFTKLLRPIVKHWRSQVISNVVYLDDGFDIERDVQTCTSNSGLISSDLSRPGLLLVNDEKCVWQPTQSLTWLGLNWNGETGTISITSKRIEKVNKAFQNLISHPIRHLQESWLRL